MRVLFIGDVVGRPGRRALGALLTPLREHYAADAVIANGENSAGGAGITEGTAGELFAAGVDVITTGNHVWDQPDTAQLLERSPAIIRPANYPPHTPGNGCFVLDLGSGGRLGVINLAGRTYNEWALECPFRALDAELGQLASDVRHIVVDFHAGATSEKQALGLYGAGRVSAVVGTHTHVQTADARILPGDTAFLTDVGMTGPLDSVIGVEPDPAIRRFLTQLPVRNRVAGGRVVLSMALLDTSDDGRAVSIETHYSVHDL